MADKPTSYSYFAPGVIKQTDLAEAIRKSAAALLDQFNLVPVIPSNEANRLIGFAKQDLESSIMWAVKALSRQ